MNLEQLFHGPNAGYIWHLYEQYQRDPRSVDEATRTLFAHWTPEQAQEPGAALRTTGNGRTNGSGRPQPVTAPTTAPAPPLPVVDAQPAAAAASLPALSLVTDGSDTMPRVAGVVNLANVIRDFGHLAADIDPLGKPMPGDPLLELGAHGLSAEDLRELPGYLVGGPCGAANSAAEAIAALRRVYSGSIGFDIAHIHEPAERAWLRAAAESRRYHPDNMPIDGAALLHRLTQVEGFEQFLHKTFFGKKRFSIEGLDMLVPMLDEILARATEQGVQSTLVGMAHRGRLNVLTHVMQKPYRELLMEFKDIFGHEGDVNWTGDVKYHYGYRRQIEGRVQMVVEMADNPSHLELVNPVVEGMARAAGSQTDRRGEVSFDPLKVLPILIHGDAAFAGQGIVPETLNMSRLPGWRTGGTLHIIANNQVGYTTDTVEARSTLYASDIAKGFEIPVVHVNADDVEACIEVARLAFAYQAHFEKDFLIDLVGYRRYGHNEGDEPRFTQPVMYNVIDNTPTVRVKWASALVQRGQIGAETAEQLLNDHFSEMQTIYDGIDTSPSPPTPFSPDKHTYSNLDTGVPAEQLAAYNSELLQLPKGFKLHSGLKRVLSRREQALSDPNEAAIDWGQAEALAFASILADGVPIRLTGEDVERGTFSHRHAALKDIRTGARYMPLQVLEAARASFECRNSALSENAAIGFEYGYVLKKAHSLVLWEAQFGDFINGAQPVIDEYLVAGKAKWDHTAPLVLLLPHGYEGQGPDHSSARLERFLMLAADRNIRVVYPTTAAQYFHLLRRHVALLTHDARPLVVMSPKSLLRHPMARSALNELATGHWQPVIDDPTFVDEAARARVRRLVLCSGKVYVEAVTSEQRPADPPVAFVRVEQLYRFPMDEVQQIIGSYPNLREIVWMQEEAMNGGAWTYVQPLLLRLAGERLPVHYLGRPHRASPAEGSLFWHKINQDRIFHDAYDTSKLG